MTAVFTALLLAAVVHYLYGGIRLQSAADKVSGAAQAQLSALFGMFLLLKGVDYWLDRFDLTSQTGGDRHRHDLHPRPRGAARRRPS